MLRRTAGEGRPGPLTVVQRRQDRIGIVEDAALAAGIICQVTARHLRIPGIVLLLGAGVALGPDGLDVVRPTLLGHDLHVIVGFATAVILFEGGLSLERRRLRRLARGAAEEAGRTLATGVYAGVSSLETGITLPEDPDLLDAGGGILFHMPERDSRNGAHMVRLAGQDELIWGYYDQNGAFVGQGRAELEPAEQATRELQVVAGDGVYHIELDGQDIAQDVPLKQQEGWIGLISYRGPVAFDNISVTFGTAE